MQTGLCSKHKAAKLCMHLNAAFLIPNTCNRKSNMPIQSHKLSHCASERSKPDWQFDSSHELNACTHSLVRDCVGLSKGMVNQKVLPSPTLDMAPREPPSTDTCLEHMLRPRPVPPLVRGRFMSSSVPCAPKQVIIQNLTLNTVCASYSTAINTAAELGIATRLSELCQVRCYGLI